MDGDALDDSTRRHVGCCDDCREQLLAGWLTPARRSPIWLESAAIARNADGHRSRRPDTSPTRRTRLAADAFPLNPERVLVGRLVLSRDEARRPHVVELHLLDATGTLRSWSSDVVPPASTAAAG